MPSMRAPDLISLLAALETMPAELRSAAERLGEDAARVVPPGGGFSLLEQAWHLADLEAEGYGVRIARLLREDEPALPDFDGARIAAERDYRSKDLAEGIAAFAAARAANLARLRSLAPEAWTRAGSQEGVGPLILRDVPRMMKEHDDSHRAEILGLECAALRSAFPSMRVTTRSESGS
jgi:DinB family protein